MAKNIVFNLKLNDTEFKNAMKDSKQAIRQANANMRMLDQEFKRTGNEVEILKNHIENYNKNLKTSKDIVKAQEKELNRLTEAIEKVNEKEAAGGEIAKKHLKNRDKAIEKVKEITKARERELETIEAISRAKEEAEKNLASGDFTESGGRLTELTTSKGEIRVAKGQAMQQAGAEMQEIPQKVYSHMTNLVDKSLNFEESISGALRLASKENKEEVRDLAEEIFSNSALEPGVIGDIIEGAVKNKSNNGEIDKIRGMTEAMVAFIGTSGMNSDQAMNNINAILANTGKSAEEIPKITSAFNELENVYGADTKTTMGITTIAMADAGNAGYDVDFVSGLSGFIAKQGGDEAGSGSALGKLLNRVSASQFETKELDQAIGYFGSIEEIDKRLITGGKEFSNYLKSSLNISKSDLDAQVEQRHLLEDVSKYTGESIKSLKSGSKEELLFKMAESIKAEAEQTGKNIDEVVAGKDYLADEVRENRLIQQLLSNTDEAKAMTQSSKEGYAKGTSTMDEYNEYKETDAYKMKEAKNQLEMSWIEIGKTLTPVVQDVVKGMQPVAEVVGFFAKIATYIPGLTELLTFFGMSSFITGKGLEIVGTVKEIFGKLTMGKGSATKLAGDAAELGDALESTSGHTKSFGSKLTSTLKGIGLFAGAIYAGTKAVEWLEGKIQGRRGSKHADITQGKLTQSDKDSIERATVRSSDKATMGGYSTTEMKSGLTGKDASGEIVGKIDNIEKVMEDGVAKSTELFQRSEEALKVAKTQGAEEEQRVQNLINEIDGLSTERDNILLAIKQDGGRITAEQSDRLASIEDAIIDTSGALSDNVTQASTYSNALRGSNLVDNEEDYKALATELKNQATTINEQYKETIASINEQEKSGKLSQLEATIKRGGAEDGRRKSLDKLVEALDRNAGRAGINSTLAVNDRQTLAANAGYSGRATGVMYGNKKAIKAREQLEGSRINTKALIDPKQIKLATQFNARIKEIQSSALKLNTYSQNGKTLFDGLVNSPNALQNLTEFRDTFKDTIDPSVKANLDATIESIQHYESLTPEEKRLYIDQKAAEKGVELGEYAVGEWDSLTPQIKDLITDETEAVAGVNRGKMTAEEWNALSIPEKVLKILADNPAARTAALGIVGIFNSIIPSVITVGVKLAKWWSGDEIPHNKFGTGVLGHPEDGPAVLGDGYRKEKVILPTGETFDSADTPTTYWLPKGTKVYPSAKFWDMKHGKVPQYKNGIGFPTSGEEGFVGGIGVQNITINTEVHVNGGKFNEEQLAQFVGRSIERKFKEGNRSNVSTGRDRRI